MDNKLFEYNIENMKQDLAIENMTLTNNQIEMLKQYELGSISMNQIIDNIKNEYGA